MPTEVWMDLLQVEGLKTSSSRSDPGAYPGATLDPLINAHPYYSTPVSAEDDMGRNFDTWKPLRFDYHGDGQSRGASDHFPVSFVLDSKTFSTVY